MPVRFHLVARTGNPDFLDLPWEKPLEELETERLASVVRGPRRRRAGNTDQRIFCR